jgi:hypothetical protein
MFIKPNAVSEVPEYWNMPVMFQAPAQLLVIGPDGGEPVVVGYGIGDIIKIVTPRVETLECRREEVDFVTLSDGSKILKPDGKWPDIKRCGTN